MIKYTYYLIYLNMIISMIRPEHRVNNLFLFIVLNAIVIMFTAIKIQELDYYPSID